MFATVSATYLTALQVIEPKIRNCGQCHPVYDMSFVTFPVKTTS